MSDLNYGLLDAEEENNFHKVRPLPVEHRPLKRVIDRLISPNSQLFKPSQNQASENPPSAEDIAQWRDEMLLEFANLESTMARIQLLRRSNAREQERYATEKVKILNAAHQIRENTVELKEQFEAAQQTLALRKQYDEMTEKITSNRMLRPREGQEAQLEKLSGEIADLEAESAEYKQTWVERRVQFGKIVEEGRQMLAMIKDEKEEAERKEGMDGGGDEADGAVSRAPMSTVGTPRFDAGGNTPLPDGDATDRAAPPLLNVPSQHSSGMPGLSRVEENDVEMGEAATTPALTNLTSEIEEGEAEEDDGPDGMDES
jgi:Tho complex subunit 7